MKLAFRSYLARLFAWTRVEHDPDHGGGAMAPGGEDRHHSRGFDRREDRRRGRHDDDQDECEHAPRDAVDGSRRCARPPARDEHGEVRTASIAIYGDTIHSFVERGGYRGVFLPGYTSAAEDALALRQVNRLEGAEHPVLKDGFDRFAHGSNSNPA